LAGAITSSCRNGDNVTAGFQIRHIPFDPHLIWGIKPPNIAFGDDNSLVSPPGFNASFDSSRLQINYWTEPRLNGDLVLHRQNGSVAGRGNDKLAALRVHGGVNHRFRSEKKPARNDERDELHRILP
jgi:hypothetical protein